MFQKVKYFRYLLIVGDYMPIQVKDTSNRKHNVICPFYETFAFYIKI